MFKINKPRANRLDIEMSGSLNAEEMKAALDELMEKSKDIRSGLMLYDVLDFHLPSLSAIAIELSRFSSMFGFMRKFRRAAVLTDKTWLQKVSELESVFYPDLEIRAFSREEKDAANKWLEEEIN